MGSRFNRSTNTRKQYTFIYIFTEGKETEPLYFKFKKSEIRSNDIKIEIKGKGYNTASLVDFALDFIKNENIDLAKDECWVVFDKDDFNKDFNSAIEKAESNGLKAAYSNEAFELWFLLHFDLMSSAIGRKTYNRKITEKYRKLTGDKKYKYDKVESVKPLIEAIKKWEPKAINFAKQLLQQHKKEKSYLKKNPSTTVHILVERINKLK